MDLLKPLIALLAIVNPIGVVPFFIHFTQTLTREQRRRTIRVSACTAFIVIAVSALAGLKIIEFFGISLASFQVGGGTLLLISAIQCSTRSRPRVKRRCERRQGEGRRRRQHRCRAADDSLLTGPATISTMVIYAEKTRHWWELGVLVGYGVVVEALATFLAFSASGRIARVLGQTGINIMTRLMGLILAALAVELLADGLTKLFPVLATRLAN